jgi:hypothetical protein
MVRMLPLDRSGSVRPWWRGACARGYAATTLLLALTLPQPARANLRAPRRVPHDGSSALYPAAGNEVLREELSFACKHNACVVTARYTVRAREAQELALSFIVPGAVRVRTSVSGKEQEARMVESEALDPRELASLSLDTRQDPQTLHKASFNALLQAGENVIEVRYTQPGDGVERDYGYFSDGSFVYQVRYELWPLKEWTLAADFKLTLNVSYQREKTPSAWKRLFGRFDTIACANEQGKRVGKRASRSERTSNWSSTLSAKQLPDRLICSMGRESLVDLPE